MVARFGSRADGPRLLEITSLDSRRVAQEALAGLRRHGVSDEMARAAWDRATDVTTPQTGRRRIFLRVLTLASRWVAAELALKALIHADEGISELGAGLLAHTTTTWNHSSTAPTPGQLEVLKQLLDEAQGSKSRVENRALLDEFRHIVGRWR
jgi:hypothetical protein